MWNLPRPEAEPMFPALAGGFFTTEPSGSPVLNFFLTCFLVFVSNKGIKVHINLVETYSFIQY